jgi:ABC-2 type transport system permease protein
MHNTFIIAKREYLERVRSRSFVIMTFLIPVLMFGASVGPALLMNRGTGETKHMMVVTADRDTGELIRSRIEQRQDEEKSGSNADNAVGKKRSLPPTHFAVEISTDTSDAAHAALIQQVRDKKLDGFLWATPDAIATRKLAFVTNDTSSFIENSTLGASVSDALRRNALKNKGLKADEIEAALQPVEVDPQSPMGKDAPNPQTMIIATLVLTMIMYVTVLLYGINVMRSILEEKTSRIMEVMLSTASAKEMMAGKILGVGAVGLTQVGIWALTAGILSAGTLVASADILKNVLSIKLLVFFGIYFLLGYILYSALCAAVGSMVNSEQEAQQLQFVVIMPLILSVILIVNIFQHPSSSMAFWGSMFPFTAPLVMFSRIALQTPPAWQIGLSIGLMLVTIYALVWLCSRIYRVGILMYGKKPNLPEIMKWIKYA